MSKVWQDEVAAYNRYDVSWPFVAVPCDFVISLFHGRAFISIGSSAYIKCHCSSWFVMKIQDRNELIKLIFYLCWRIFAKAEKKASISAVSHAGS